MPSNRAREAANAASQPTADQPGTEVQPKSRELVLRQNLDRMKPELQRALPATLANDADRWARIAFTVIRSNPKLLACTDSSLLGALMASTSLGLEPGPLGLSYWVPFWNKAAGSDEAVFIIGYRGLINLARRSGNIADVVARPVYPSDEFDVEYGVNDRLHHKPNLDRDGDEQPTYFYSVARYTGEGHHIHVMNRGEIEKFRDRSRAKNAGPWVTDYNAMAMKTVIRRAATWWPMNIELARALNADETIQRATTADGMQQALDTPAEYDGTGVRELEPTRDAPTPPSRTVQGETVPPDPQDDATRALDAAVAKGYGVDDVKAVAEAMGQDPDRAQSWSKQTIDDIVTEFNAREPKGES